MTSLLCTQKHSVPRSVLIDVTSYIHNVSFFSVALGPAVQIRVMHQQLTNQKTPASGVSLQNPAELTGAQAVGQT